MMQESRIPIWNPATDECRYLMEKQMKALRQEPHRKVAREGIERGLFWLVLKWMTTEEKQKKTEEEAQVYAVVVSAVALLSLVYQYLTGYIDRGGTKTYSRGSSKFRPTYVSILLFQGAYFYEDLKNMRVIHTSIVHLNEQVNARHHCSLPGERFEPVSKGPSVALDPEFRVEEYLNLSGDIDTDFSKCLEDLRVSPDVMSNLLDAEHLQRYIDRGGTKTYSRGSSEFRPTYVSILLFQGAYVYENLKNMRVIHTSNVHLNEQINARHHCSLRVEHFEPVALEPEFRVEEYLTLPGDFDAGSCKFLEDLPEHLENFRVILHKCLRLAKLPEYPLNPFSLPDTMPRHLTGYIDRGRTKTYSPGSVEFGPTYVSMVLFQGAYVWIKFRDVVSSKRGGYRRPIRDKLSGTSKLSDKIEARYKPPRESGNHNHIYLGVCATNEEAEIKKKIAAFYYGRNEGRLNFEDGQYFPIPSMQTEQQQDLDVTGKRAWVKSKVREVYEDFKNKRAIHTSTVDLDEQINARHHSSLPAEHFEPVSQGSSVALDPEFRVEEYLDLSGDIDADFSKCLEDLLVSPDVMSNLPDAEPQPLQDNRVQDSVLAVPTAFDNHSGSPFDTEPLQTYSAWGSENIVNVVQESSEVAATPNEVDVGGLTIEGAPHNSQAVSEFPLMSPIPTLQQGSDPTAVLAHMVKQSVINLCPTSSTSDLLVLKVISLLQQQIQEKDRKNFELERENEEKGRKIFELERENERLRGT